MLCLICAQALLSGLFVKGILSQGGIQVSTPFCDIVIGGSVELKATFTTFPSDPVRWIRLPATDFGSCRPNYTCGRYPGYQLTQSNSGLNYTILIEKANVADHNGTIEISENSGVRFTQPLDLQVNLSTIDVECIPDAYTPSSGTVTCTTECMDEDVSVGFLLENSPHSGFPNSSTDCPSGRKRYSSTTNFASTSGMTGNKTLCYTLSTGICSHTQSEPCIIVEFTEPPTTTGGTAELSTTASGSTGGPTTEKPDCGSCDCDEHTLQIVFLVVGITVALIHIGLLLALKCTSKFTVSEHKGRCCDGKCKIRCWLFGLHAVGILVAIIAVILLGIAIGCIVTCCQRECLKIAGIVLVVISILLAIVCGVLYCVWKRPNCVQNGKKKEEVEIKETPNNARNSLHE